MTVFPCDMSWAMIAQNLFKCIDNNDQVMKFVLFPNKAMGVQQKKMFFPLWFNLHLFLKISMLRPNAPFLTSGVER